MCEYPAYGHRSLRTLSVTWVVLAPNERVPRLHELMDFVGYTRVGNDASCNDPVGFFRLQRRMIDLDRNKGTTNEGSAFPGRAFPLASRSPYFIHRLERDGYS